MKVSKFSPYAFIFPILLLLSSFAQAQTLRGTVRDADSGLPVAGASLSLESQQANGTGINMRSDSAGQFSLSSLHPGYYTCRIEATGFDPQILAEINVAAGKERLLNIALHRSASQLPEITIAAEQPGRRRIQPISEIPLTRDQTLRFPAMYFDPARLAMAYPGVSQADDGTNHMSIRGNSPGSVRWYLEGVDVVNPNHLPNAGTFSDLPGGAGGGVLMFSSQLLDNSSLLTGNYPTSIGDAQGGVMDMYLRAGNNRQQEFTAQAGLIGLDVAAEGPLSKKENAPSYLVNYRYSTVGLLSQMGISFGDEAINFQDLSFNLNLPGKKGGSWSVFGMGGLSDNQFTHKDPTDIEANKDRYDISFKSKTGLIGTRGLIRLGAKTWLKPTLALSAQTNERTAQEKNSEPFIPIRTENASSEARAAGAISLEHAFTNHLRLQVGVHISNINYRYNAAEFIGTFPATLPESPLNFQSGWGWVQLDWKSRSDKTSVQLGANHSHLGLQKTASLEPRLTVTQRLSKRQRVTAAFGLYSQLQPLWAYAIDPNSIERGNPNLNVKPTKSAHYGLQYTWNNGNNWVVKAGGYYQYLYDVPVTPGRPAFSLLNYNDPTRLGNLVNTGAGKNKGLELNVERYLRQGWFLLANVSLFDSQYRGSDSTWRSTRWDLGHLANLTLGKEWTRDRATEKVRVFGLNARAVWSGGYRAMPVDLLRSGSNLLQKTIFDENEGFSEQFPDYFRIDIRAYWKRNLGNRRNSIFAMDLQNVTMQKNVAYQFYETFSNTVETKYQLGLIPNISWRLEF